MVAKQPIKRTQTVREKAAEQSAKADKKPRKLRQATTSAKGGATKVSDVARKEYYLPMPNNKIGRFLNKRRRFIPKYFREAWVEVRQVTWPTRRESLKLTSAVIIFTVVFGAVITLTDYGLDKIFRKVLLDS
jgi:preprotein translocase subunit SecE